ncbi:MAG: ABC transporter substrate-binding protein [Proteobacteria bacterium]|nr:ABC transporter substrate-binding protein [Pseudomonadota bacterium]
MAIFLRAVILAVVFLAAAQASAQDKILRIVVAYPPGASSDIITRLIADKMRVALGQPVIVDNKPGAGGIVGTEAVKNAAPDGGTILFTPLAPMVAFPHSYAKLRYDPFNDFEPIAHLTDFQLAFGVGAQVPARTLAGYVALVKTDPGYSNYASAAAGSLPHFFGVMFGQAAGIELTHIPYKGTAPVLTALAGGEIAAAMTVLSDLDSLVQGGKARLLAVSGAKRAPSAPDVPTFGESGYAIEGNAWYALFAPAKTPAATIVRYAQAAIDAVKSPDLNQRLVGMGLEPTAYGPVELAAILRRDYDKWGPVIRASGFRPEQ